MVFGKLYLSFGNQYKSSYSKGITRNWQLSGSGRKKKNKDKNLEQKTSAVFKRNLKLSEHAVAVKVMTSASTIHWTKGRAVLDHLRFKKFQREPKKKK